MTVRTRPSFTPPRQLPLSSNIKIYFKIAIQRLDLPFLLPFINDAIGILASLICAPVLSLGQLGSHKMAVTFKLVDYPLVESVLPVN